MNFFEGRLKDGANVRATVDAGGLGTLEAVAGDARMPAPGAQVAVAVRPEKMSLAWKEPQAAGHSVKGKVKAEAYFGDRSHYYVEVEGLRKPVAVAHQNAERSLDDSSAIGRTVWLTWPASAAVLLVD
jgi:ABC-type Fe3+/spermidine/putrescine transport system ATPase subunit